MKFIKKQLKLMKHFHEVLLTRPLIFSIYLSAFLFGVLYPEIFFFLKSPMGIEKWELQDPVVSHFVFIPGLRVLQYELFHHLNILWTPLRNFGTPILANEIQVAPLFPLTLLFIWAPPAVFWNLLVISRVVLTGTISCLFSIQILKFTRIQSFIFTLTFVFGLYVMRWMNHPWQNGFLAGLLYLYGLARSLNIAGANLTKERFFWVLFQSFSVYCLITCGFPEAAALGVVLTWLVLLPLCLVQFLRNRYGIMPFFKSIVLSHFLGFCLGSVQIFSLIEYMHLAGLSFRVAHGLNQFDSFQIFWKMITRFYYSLPSPVLVHFFGLIPVFLFNLGIFSVIRHPKKMNSFDFGALLAGLFYIFKCFKVWPLFNLIVGGVPILKQSLFTIYFFPILLWSFAYFSAKGVLFLSQSLDYSFVNPKPGKVWFEGGRQIFPILLSLGVVGLLIAGAAQDAPELKIEITFKVLAIFFIFIFATIAAFVSQNTESNKRLYLCFLVILLLFEFKLYQPGHFIGSISGYRNTFGGSRAVDFFKNSHPIEDSFFKETRERSSSGEFMSDGLATLDNGASAILTDRAMKLRTTLFESDGDGYLPIKNAKVSYAWQLVSAGAFWIHQNTLLELSNKDPIQFKHLQMLGETNLTFGVFDNQTLPRAYLPSDCISVLNLDESVKKVSNSREFKLGRAVFENLNPVENEACRGLNKTVERVAILDDSGTSLLLGPIQGPNFLVLNDSYYPGWHALDLLSGNEVKISPANINFRGLILPERRMYQIQFKYRPIWLNWSIALIMIAIALVSALAYRIFRIGQLER